MYCKPTDKQRLRLEAMKRGRELAAMAEPCQWCCVSCRDEWQNHSNRAQAH